MAHIQCQFTRSSEPASHNPMGSGPPRLISLSHTRFACRLENLVKPASPRVGTLQTGVFTPRRRA